MKLKLSDWLCVRWDQQQIADVLAQLLTTPRQNYGAFLNPDVFSIEYPDDDEDSRFGDLTIRRKADGYAKEYTPVQPRHDTSDDVFIVGLMLYKLLTGMDPDLSAAGFLMAQGYDEKSVPLLEVSGERLGSLVAPMTDLNPRTRISREEVLDRLAKMFSGMAYMCIVEEETLTELERIRIPLRNGANFWQPATHLRYGEQVFQPKKPAVWNLPYRLKPIEYQCMVVAQHVPMPDVTRLHFQQWESCFAIDLGHSTIRVARLTPKKRPEGLPPFPAVIAFRERDLPVFGRDAMHLAETSPAELIWCMPAGNEPPENRTVLAADGSSIQITPQKAARIMMDHIVRDAHELGFEENSPASITMSAGHTSAVRTLWHRAALDAGFNANMVAAQTAALLYQRLYEPVTGDVMVIDAGSGSTDVCVISCGTGMTPGDIAAIGSLWTHSYAAPGGGEMTNVIINNMLQTINLQHGLALYRLQDAELPAEVFATNRRRIRKAAEQMKRTLSFSEQASERVELISRGGTSLFVRFRYTRQQLLTLLEPYSRQLRIAMKQACADCGAAPDQIQTVLVTGGASLSPALRQTVSAFLQHPNCRIVYLDHQNAVIRGTVFYAALCDKREEDDGTVMNELPYDLGIIAADPVKAMPVFQPLIRAGIPMPDGKAKCTHECEVTGSDLDAQGRFQIRLYSRPRGMEHIHSTLDPEGSRIRILGILKIVLPEEFKLAEDKLLLHISVNADESVTATADHLTRKAGLFSLLSGKRSEWTEAVAGIPGYYHPLS
ncbi:MAG: Hsp70 family protein [Oscillospiraceae bacterium]|nr:Hsp70 family protein [Oscillospiraceae bacterium]